MINMKTNIVTLTPPIRGYKAFSYDWTCKGKQYTCPGVFEEPGYIKLCERGIHFCLKLRDVYKYYQFSNNTKVAEVIAEGVVLSNGKDANFVGLDTKFVTNKLRIVRELSWDEINELINSGEGDIGIGNSGNYNIGHFNTGSYNYGSRNSGNYNFGNKNSGDYNIGNNNTGDYNYGTFNAGNHNRGNHNTGNFNYGFKNVGNFNKGSYLHGAFNNLSLQDIEKSSGVMMFNKPCTSPAYIGFCDSFAFHILTSKDSKFPSQLPQLKFIDINTCKDEYYIMKARAMLKDNYGPTKDSIGITIVTSPCSNADRQKWWNELSDTDKQTILNIPNFDHDIFLDITGIDVYMKPVE